MNDETRLSQLTTQWTLLARTHAADRSEAESARDEFLPQYCAPVYRYLRGILIDADLAEELAQEFAFRFIRGDFRHFRPEKGRFRDYLKSSLRHLVAEWRRRPGRLDTLPPDSRLLLREPDVDDEDREFLEVWRGELLERVWQALQDDSIRKGNRHYEALRLRSEDSNRRSATIAALMSEGGAVVSADAARQMLHRARARFAELLRAEIAATVRSQAHADIDDELADLGLLIYCQNC